MEDFGFDVNFILRLRIDSSAAKDSQAGVDQDGRDMSRPGSCGSKEKQKVNSLIDCLAESISAGWTDAKALQLEGNAVTDEHCRHSLHEALDARRQDRETLPKRE